MDDAYAELSRQYGLVQTVAPTEEPITSTEAKAYLRQDETAEDTLVASLIVAARQLAETYTGRAFVTQTWKLTLWQFPCGPYGVIQVPRPPLQSVSGIAYTDNDGATQTVATSVYTADTTAHPGLISLKFGQYWPYARFQAAAVQVTFVAGYGAASAVPELLKTALRKQVVDWYEGRAERDALSPAVRSILDLYWAGAITGGF